MKKDSSSVPAPPSHIFGATIFPMPSSKANQDAANQIEIYRNMSGEQRILIAFEMSMREKESRKDRIRKEHPEWNEQQVSRELLRLEFLPDPLPKGF